MFCEFDFLTKEQNVLLTLVRKTLFENDLNVDIDSVDLSELWREASIQTVPLLSMNTIDSDGGFLGENEYAKNKLQSYFLRNIAVGTEHAHLHNLLSKAGISYVIIKGMASSAYYPDELMRLMGDVDFIVKKEDMSATDKVLSDAGYVARKKENAHHITYDKDGMRCEMHFLPPGIPDGDMGSKISSFFDDITEKACVKETSLGEISMPSVFHHGLILLLHTIHHLIGDGLGLRHLCDWAVFVSHFSEDEFRNIFESPLKDVGIWRFAVILTKVCADFLGATTVINDDECNENFCNRLISDIFSSGNFGQKNPDRSHESLFISKNSKDNTNIYSLFLNAILAVNEIVYSHWKIARKCKLFLIPGWLFFGGRYILRSIMGKRPEIRMNRIIDEARERSEFYDSLKLFEV